VRSSAGTVSDALVKQQSHALSRSYGAPRREGLQKENPRDERLIDYEHEDKHEHVPGATTLITTAVPV
jgi:hypothetical protein